MQRWSQVQKMSHHSAGDGCPRIRMGSPGQRRLGDTTRRVLRRFYPTRRRKGCLERHTLRTVGTQDGLLLEERLVLLPNPFNPLMGSLQSWRVKYDHELGRLPLDDPLE